MSELHLVEQEEVGEGALVELVHSRSPQRRPVSELRYQSQGIGSFRAISGETPHAQRFFFCLGSRSSRSAAALPKALKHRVARLNPSRMSTHA